MPAYRDKHGRWRFRFTYKGERHSGSAPPASNTKKTAEALERQLLDKLVARVFVGVMPTFETLAVTFLDHQLTHTKGLTHLNHEHVVRNHLVPHLGEMKIDDVDTLVIDQLKPKWTCATSTKNMRLRVLRRMLSLAVEWSLIAKSPRVRMIPVPDAKADPPRFLTDAEQDQLIEAARARDASTRQSTIRGPVAKWWAMVVVALRTGMRIGELRGLEWGDVEIDKARVQVRRTLSGKAKFPDPTTPKGGRSRVLPLTADARAALEAIRPAAPKPTDRVWPNPGRSEASCVSSFGRIVATTSIANQDEVSWHTTRHTFASQLAIRGVSLRVIQELLGHASITTTEIYAHLLPGSTHLAIVSGLDMPVLDTSALEAPNQATAKALPAPSKTLVIVDE